MIEFLADDELASKIRYVVDGEDVNCAVAYWSNHGFDIEKARDWKIICDVHGGGTSPRSLRKIFAPDNDNLFYSPGLHCKIYLSTRGAVVGSANASERALRVRTH